jgi:uncharacterized LabA/DUF88 family protein
MLTTKTRRVGVFIDVQNMYYSARNLFDRKVNFANIVKDTVGDANLVRALAYTISTKGGEEEPFFEALRKSGIEVISKELLEYAGGNKKGDWDVGVTIDIVRSLDMLDVVVLVSGDGDFVPLGEYVKSRGRVFHVASFRESTSTSLVDAADVYTNLSDSKRKFLITSGARSTSSRTAKTPAKSTASSARTTTTTSRTTASSARSTGSRATKPAARTAKTATTRGRAASKPAPVKGTATRNTIQRTSSAYKKPYPDDAPKNQKRSSGPSFFEESTTSNDTDDINESRSRRLTF